MHKLVLPDYSVTQSASASKNCDQGYTTIQITAEDFARSTFIVQCMSISLPFLPTAANCLANLVPRAEE